MDAMENILTRRSIRVYEDRPVDRAVLEEVLSAARMAPSWKNTQTADCIVADQPNPELREKLMACLPSFNAKTFSTAPVLIIMTSKKGRCGYEKDGSFSTTKEDRWEMFDAGIACQTLCLAAWAKGLGTCIMGLYDEEKLPALLNLPEDRYITALITLGYPAQSPEAPRRKSTEEKVQYV